ncbi:type II toxin-antitoxin system death-on-curing family toxin [Mycoplasma feriruminatoris]|uniref:type II toxin-antitoxin system death-on-curing family toxin n=1 Tax=Mycoplasma feriruminatoris TaxID=1179777 RepID=UPI00241C1BD1|nr:type II toxin-antitoxin system death-on-curing family toxin [Mycoplasma feriruminatoris]WFQ90154.1 hypothetical protein MFERI11561_00404 [Mycoplasma feriruminatoris]WFQ90978.1 type II toxin-antitoxin system death-on-curing family toxin [Mycoplasma feriruminatoris]
MKKPINSMIYITTKTFNNIKEKTNQIVQIPEQNIDYLPFSNKKRVYFDKDEDSFYLWKKDKTDKWKINIKFQKIEFDQELIEYMDIIIDQALLETKKIFQSENNDISFKEKEIGALKSAVFSIVNKFDYYNEQVDIFDFVTEILIRILTGHYLIDGNKRTALMVLILTLKQFVYYFYWSSKNDIFFIQHYEEHIENDLVSFTHKLQDKFKTEEITLKIKDWIYDRTMINFDN